MVFDLYEEANTLDNLTNPIYITFADNDLGTFTREEWAFVSQNKLSFGMLEIESNTTFKYQ